MRRVERTKIPASLDGPSSAGGKERAAAEVYYADPKKAVKAYDFKAYKAADVRDAMREMFHYKCAYCESDYSPVVVEDVEHYRPKAAYLEHGKPRPPGYWWLAMEWTNLLPSCPDCNRERGQDLGGADGTEVAGKANQFPIEQGSVRGTYASGVDAERPLLLNPTVDDPSEHLEFLPNGIVRAAKQGTVASRRGLETIKVVALKRDRLVRAREKAARETQAAITRVTEVMDDVRDAQARTDLSATQRAERLGVLQARMKRELSDLESKADPSTPYSAVAEAWVRKFKAEHNL